MMGREEKLVGCLASRSDAPAAPSRSSPMIGGGGGSGSNRDVAAPVAGSAVALRAASLTARRTGGRVVAWIRRGERLVVVKRSGNRVRCRLGSEKYGWASVTVERTGTPLLRLRGDAATETTPLEVLGQRSQDTLDRGKTRTIRRVALSPYRPLLAPEVESGDTVDGALSVVKVVTQSSQQKVPLSSTSSALPKDVFTLHSGCRMAEEGNLPAVKEVVAHLGKDVVHHATTDGHTLLHCAARGAQLEIVQYLVALGAPLNGADFKGRTPLMDVACCPGPLAHLCAATLVAAGADHGLLDSSQHDATHHASLHGHSSVLRILLGAGASVSGRCVPLGRTPLHLAAENNHIVCVQLLVDAHADIDARTADGMSPLHCAAWRDALGPMHLLLRSRADASVRTQEGYTALDLAAGFSNQHCAQLLQYDALLGTSERASEPPDHRDLEVFSTPQQLLEEGGAVSLSDRAVAGLAAVADCLAGQCAPESSSLDMAGDSTSQQHTYGELRPLSAKSKAVASLLTFGEYEQFKKQQPQQTSNEMVNSGEEISNPAEPLQATSSISTNSQSGSVSRSSQSKLCDTSNRNLTARQRSAPAFRSIPGSRTSTNRPQTAAATLHRVMPRRIRRGHKQQPANVGPGSAHQSSSDPLVFSMQGTVRSATLGWGIHEWEQATSQFKLAPTTPEVIGAAAGAVNNSIASDMSSHRTSKVIAGSASSPQLKLEHLQNPTRVRPKSAVSMRPPSGNIDGLASSASWVDFSTRPGSAIPTTTEWQPPGVEEAAAHYLTTAQKMKRQKERLKLSLRNEDGVGNPRIDSNNSSTDIDLSLYYAETGEERQQREDAEMQAATRIQAVARGHFLRRRQQQL